MLLASNWVQSSAEINTSTSQGVAQGSDLTVTVSWQTFRRVKDLLQSLQTFWQDQCPTSLQGWREESILEDA